MNIFIVLWNDLRILFKDFPQVAELFLMPLAFILPVCFALGSGNGYGVNADNRRELLPVLNYDGGKQAQALIDSLSESYQIEKDYGLELASQLDLKDDPACASKGLACDEKIVAAMLDRRWRREALVIPAGFSAAVDAGQKTSITIRYDPAGDSARRMQLEGVVKGAAIKLGLSQTRQAAFDQFTVLNSYAPDAVKESLDQQAAQSAAAQGEGKETQAPAVTFEKVKPANYTLPQFPDTFQQTVPGYTVMFVFFIISYLTGAINDEKRSGAYRRLLTLPVQKSALLGGKLLGAILITLAQVALMFAIGVFIFKLDLGRAPLALVLLTLCLAACAASLGLAAACVKGIGSILTAPLIVGALLGGCMFPTDIMPPFLRIVSYITPHHYALQGYQNIMVRGQGLVEVLPQMGALLGFAVVFLLIAIWRFDFEE